MHVRPVVDTVSPAMAAGDQPHAASPISTPAARHKAILAADAPDWPTLRFRQELASLETLPGLAPQAASLLAAHAAGCAMAMRPDRAGRSSLAAICAALATVRPVRAELEATLSALGLKGGALSEPADELFAQVEALWTLAAPTEQLLASGGDDRLTLDARTGANKYGCTPWPRPDVISFSSCTASSPSEGAFAAAASARHSLLAAALATSPATALAEASDSIGQALLSHFGVADLADAVLAASGTDAALVVTGLLAAERPGEGLTSILVSPSETGSGVPDAVQGRHFASCAPSGSLVGKGEPIEGLPAATSLVTIALRDGRGLPLPPAAIEASCEAAIRAGIGQGRVGGKVVLHAIDGSKTGLSAPDRAACRRLADQFGASLDIVIDACQARIEPDMIRWYIEQGFPVLITGSKFFAAPGFCGAVLFPRARLQRIRSAGRLPAGLAAYARLQGGFGSRRCPGLILRWTAALHDMRVFGALPAPAIRNRLDGFGKQIRAALARDERLFLIPAPRPPGPGWSDRRSVFTFAVRGATGWMSAAQLRALYVSLGEGAEKCRIGQPVELGTGGLGGLRLAISAAQVVSGEDQSARLAHVIGKLCTERPLS